MVHSTDDTHSKSVTGPDAQRVHGVQLKGPNGRRVDLDLFGSELCLRGDALVTQPHVDAKTSNVLCWNGEVRSRSLISFFTRCAEQASHRSQIFEGVDVSRVACCTK